MLMLLFLCGVVEVQAVDFAGSESAEAVGGCLGIREQVQLHGRMRADDDGAVANALVDPAPRDAELLGELGDGQPAQQTAGARRRLQNPVAQADGPDRVDQNLAVPR